MTEYEQEVRAKIAEIDRQITSLEIKRADWQDDLDVHLEGVALDKQLRAAVEANINFGFPASEIAKWVVKEYGND